MKAIKNVLDVSALNIKKQRIVSILKPPNTLTPMSVAGAPYNRVHQIET